jgi:hypothetical protein
MYYIVNELSWNVDTVVSTPVGYVTTQTDADEVNANHNVDYTNWIDANKADLESEAENAGTYFASNDNPYCIWWCTYSIEGMELTEITNNTTLT